MTGEPLTCPDVATTMSIGVDINTDTVTNYLQDNPNILSEHVCKYVGEDMIESWLIAKRKARNRLRNGDLIYSREGSPHRPASEPSKSRDRDRRQQIQRLLKNATDRNSQGKLLEELASSVAIATAADGFNLYLTSEDGQAINFVSSTSKEVRSMTRSQSMMHGYTIAAYAAWCKKCIRLQSPNLMDKKHPLGVAYIDDRIHAVLALPILDADDNTTGVVELFRRDGRAAFSDTDEQTSSSIVLWGSVASDCSELHNDVMKQRKLNDFLLAVTKNIFQDIVSMDTVIMKIMDFAKKLVKADRASLFLVDNSSGELYARIFDTGAPAHDSSPCAKEIRFPIGTGVAGYVAKTGETLNIQDAYKDKRFNRDVDVKTGYTTKTLLCMPIRIRSSIFGVVQMVNKLHGTFTKTDEESFETFAVYCGLALHHAKLYDKIRKSEQKYKVALDVLSYHNQCSEEEYSKLKSLPMPSGSVVDDIPKFHFSPWSIEEDAKSLHVVYMFKDLFGLEKFELDTLFRFTLTVKKNYRKVPYHNWDHAFSVAHAMYCILKAEHKFNQLEGLALFVACLCHDLDHRGKTNAFMVKSASPLAAIYTTSVMEHHHFNQTVSILQQDNHNIFKELSSEEYKTVLGYIKECILATDLALFFGNKAKLKEWQDRSKFDWQQTEHRNTLQAVMMTGADLCASTKPWEQQRETVHVIFEEFYSQGDEEKDRGIAPLPMMDRDKADQLPESQVGFIVGICLPCYELLAQIIPASKPMVDGALSNLSKWQELSDANKKLRETRTAVNEQNGSIKENGDLL
ncbi:probable 3',5'-cyclic phosphodiesterase pde-5 isoform X2 [Watersipora subatra]|uniref:probable 3',5'-cyclic phosphodiesterase pde-5 isoform X2 n=1 Tax=Watersipora subatra TaxID=2589382 RepID=UPI00355B5439